MIPPAERPASEPLVLVAVEDPSVTDLLAFALEVQRLRVRLVRDGEQALQTALVAHPHLVIADLRLSRRSGFELCEALRRDPALVDVPVLLLASAADTEARVEALSRGADDLVSKPFSPRELMARVQRLLARSRETRSLRARAADLERELARAEADAKRARSLGAHQRELRALAAQAGEGLLRTLDLDALDVRLVREVKRATGSRSAALFECVEDGLVLRTVAGDLPERWAPFHGHGLAATLAQVRDLARPVRVSELARAHEGAEAVRQLTTHGVACLAVLAGHGAPLAVIACEDRADGAAHTAEALDRLAVLSDAAAPARAAARSFREQQDRLLEALAEPVANDPVRRTAAREAVVRISRVAEDLALDPLVRQRLATLMRVGAWGWSDAGRAAFAALSNGDATGRMRALRGIVEDAVRFADGAQGDRAEVRLAAAGLRFQSLRASGRSAHEAWRTTAHWLGLPSDPDLHERFPEAFESAS